MQMLTIAAAILAAGAVITLIGSLLIERAHPPRGRFIQVCGFPQHVVELGESTAAHVGGVPVVLLHGAGCNLEDMYVALGERLAVRQRVVMVDRPGHGWSKRPDRHASSPADQSAMLRELLDRLQIDRAIIVGHSWGGTLAATFALDHPRLVAGLVLLAPPTHPRLRNMTRLYAVLAAPLVGWLFAHTFVLPLAATSFGLGVRATFLPLTPPRNYLKRVAALLLLRPAAFLANARDIAGLQRFLAQQVPRYGALKAPTIIITGDSDQVISARDHAMALAALVPDAKLVVLPGVGHMPHHAVPDRIVAAIEELALAGRP